MDYQPESNLKYIISLIIHSIIRLLFKLDLALESVVKFKYKKFEKHIVKLPTLCAFKYKPP